MTGTLYLIGLVWAMLTGEPWPAKPLQPPTPPLVTIQPAPYPAVVELPGPYGRPAYEFYEMPPPGHPGYKYVGEDVEQQVTKDIEQRVPGYKTYRKQKYEGTYKGTEPERLPPGTRRR